MKIKVFFTKKKIIWTVIILLLMLSSWFIFFRKSNNVSIQTGVVKLQNIEKTVLATGQVVSSTDLDLSMQSSGIVKQILVKEGDVVSSGQMLVVLDQSTALANVESAKGSFAQAEANYKKILSAATTEDIAVSQAVVDSASIALQNAKQNLIRDLFTSFSNVNSAVLSNTNNLFIDPQSSNPQFYIANTVQSEQQLVSSVNWGRVKINSNFDKLQKEIMTVDDSNIDKVVIDSLSHISVVKSYLSDLLTLVTSYTFGGNATTISAYITAVNSAKTSVDASYTTITNGSQAIKSAQSALDQAKASLALKQAPPRPEDVDIAKAQVLSAEGALRSAQVALNNTVLRAPTSGTITQVDIKLGEQVVASKEVVKLLNISDLHTEALVSESDVASLMVGQSIDNTFDALGPDKHFTTTILTVNPASTVVSGVVNYKMTGSLEKIPNIKPGMTVNMTIKVAEKNNALVVPSSAIVNKNGKRIVKVINDSKNKTYDEVSVETGLLADGGLVEITSGLKEGQEIVTYMK